MPFFGALVGIALLAGVAGLGYFFASGTNYLNPKVIFVIIIVGFILSDRSLWPNRRR